MTAHISQNSKKIKYIIGIDEAGRGPLAGPVSVGAVIVSSKFNSKLLKGVRDSKKLSESQREEWYKKLKNWKKEKILNYSVTLISERTIDKKGISFAIRKAIKSCLRKLEANPKHCNVLLDGSLSAPREFLYQKTIIGGDDKIKLISLASIAAKVKRDKKMTRLAQKYPKYAFDIHKGYGTLIHRNKIKEYGPCEIHRQSFIKNLITS
jgi:ribonuclease HII